MATIIDPCIANEPPSGARAGIRPRQRANPACAANIGCGGINKGRLYGLATLAAIVTATTGCGDRMHPVAGRVVYKDGNPVSGGHIAFHSIDHDPPITATGRIQRDGAFELGTHGEHDGCPPGRYAVVIAPVPREMNASDGIPRGPVAHQKYLSPETTDLIVEIDEARDDLQLAVERPESIPEEPPVSESVILSPGGSLE